MTPFSRHRRGAPPSASPASRSTALSERREDSDYLAALRARPDAAAAIFARDMPILPSGEAPAVAVLAARRSRRAWAGRGSRRCSASPPTARRSSRRCCPTTPSNRSAAARRLLRSPPVDRARPRRPGAGRLAVDRHAGAGRAGPARHARPGQVDPAAGMSATASAPTAAPPPASPRPAGGASATSARRSISPAPTRW